MSQSETLGLAIFVKTPGLSPLKTRLAADLQQRGLDPEQARTQATRLYRASLRAVEAAVATAQRRWPQLQPYYAVAEAAALGHPRWRRWPRLWQGEGGLGARQAAIHAQLLRRHAAAVLVGSDLPWLGPTHLDPALAALQAGRDWVIGPGVDGGYYLLGARQALSAASYESVPYSSPDTLARLLAVLPADAAIDRLPTLPDLDRLADLPALLAQAPVGPNRVQRRLLRKLRAWKAP